MTDGAMRLAAVMDEIAQVLTQVTGLRTVFPYPPPTLTPPAAYVSYPESFDYDQTYQSGIVQLTGIPIVLVCGKVNDRSARDQMSVWTAADGPSSVKALLSEHKWLSCDDLQVDDSAKPDQELVAGVPYLAVVFTATAQGPGKEGS